VGYCEGAGEIGDAVTGAVEIGADEIGVLEVGKEVLCPIEGGSVTSVVVLPEGFTVGEAETYKGCFDG
jgi:hypothetical protein